MGDGFCDLAHLLTAYGQISHFFCGINLDVQTDQKALLLPDSSSHR